MILFSDEVLTQIKSRIDELVREDTVSDKRCWNLELDAEIGKILLQLFSNSFQEAFEFYEEKNIHISIMGNSVKKDVLGSGGGWHQDTRIKPQKKWFVYLNDVETPSRGPTQFLNAKQTFLIKLIESLSLNFSNRVKLQFSQWLCSKWGKHALYKRGNIFAADTRLIHRGTPIVEENYDRYALTLYAYGKHKPQNMKLTTIEVE